MAKKKRKEEIEAITTVLVSRLKPGEYFKFDVGPGLRSGEVYKLLYTSGESYSRVQLVGTQKKTNISVMTEVIRTEKPKKVVETD